MLHQKNILPEDRDSPLSGSQALGMLFIFPQLLCLAEVLEGTR